jgi:hypothetical protein
MKSGEYAKGSEVATARLAEKVIDEFDVDAEKLDETRADQIRRAIAYYRALRKGWFYCPCCDESIRVEFK